MHHFDDERHDRMHRAQHRAWSKMEAMGRRFGGGPGPGWGGPRGAGFGDWGGFGDSFRIGKMIASGDLRLIALYFIEQQPRHGYDLIKAVEEKTAGIYSPSPGVVYPALTFLEEAGYVTSAADGNKRLYTITSEGKAHLADNREAVEGTLAHLGRIGEQVAKMRQSWDEAGQNFRSYTGSPDRDMDDVAPEVNEARKHLKQAIKAAAKNPDPIAQRRLADILRRAAEEIERTGGAPRPEPEIDI
jgi:DNA-binding PadR family transcriptional regulator